MYIKTAFHILGDASMYTQFHIQISTYVYFFRNPRSGFLLFIFYFCIFMRWKIIWFAHGRARARVEKRALGAPLTHTHTHMCTPATTRSRLTNVYNDVDACLTACLPALAVAAARRSATTAAASSMLARTSSPLK